MPGMKKSVLGILIVAATALASFLIGPSAQAASTVSVRTVMYSRVHVTAVAADQSSETAPRPVGATLSIIYICPEGSDLDRTFLNSLGWARNSTRAAGFRFLSREWWPRGMVTRWRVTSNTADGEIWQSIACR